MKKLILIFLLFIYYIKFLFAINSDELSYFIEKNKNQNSNSNINNISIKEINQNNNYILDDLLIEGSEYSKNKILSILNIKIGNNIIINNIKEQLIQSTLFQKINISIQKKENNKILILLKLKDNPIISSLYLFGIKEKLFHQINNNYKLKKNQIININKIKNIAINIQKYYNIQGYINASVKYIIFKISKSRLGIIFILIKKSKLKIDQILFKGNKNIPSNELYKLYYNTFFLKKISFLNNIPFINNFLFQNIIYKDYNYDNYKQYYYNIINKYKNLGFRDAKILSNNIEYINNKYILTIDIDEGDKYYINNIDFIGNKIFNKRYISNIINYKINDNYNLLNFKQKIIHDNNKNSILSKYLDNGYIFNNIIPIEKNFIKKKVNIEINFFEGKQAIVNNNDFLGNTITNDNVIYHNSLIYQGDIFSRKNISNTINNLESSGLFEPQKINIEVNPNLNNTVNLKWHFLEKNANQIQFQSGYGLNKIQSSLTLNFNNFSIKNLFNLKKWNPIPQGNGENITLYSQIGNNFQSFGFSFINPYFLNSKFLSLNFGSNNSISQYQKYDTKYKKYISIYLSNTAFFLGIKKQLSWLNKKYLLNLSVNYERYNRMNTNMGILKLPKKGISNDLNYIISLNHLSYNDDYIFPINTSEFYITGIFTIPYSIFFHNKKMKYKWPEYFKIKTKFYWYKKLFNNLFSKIGGEFGFLNFYNSNFKFLPFQRFFIGEQNIINSQSFHFNKDYITFRGYDNFLPEGGEYYNKIITELRYPVFMNDIIKSWILSFFESSNMINNKDKLYNFFIMKKSVGIGLRIHMMNFGLLGYDLAYGFNNENSSKWKIHFIIGNE